MLTIHCVINNLYVVNYSDSDCCVITTISKLSADDTEKELEILLIE